MDFRGDYRSTIQRTLDPNGNTLRDTAPNGESVAYHYNLIGQVTQVTNPAGQAITPQFNANQQVTGLTDERGNVVNFQYNPSGALNGIGLVTPTGSLNTGFAYDEFNGLVSQTDGNGHTTYWQRDALGRTTGRTLADGRQEHFDFGASDNTLRYTGFDGKATYVAYDSMYRPAVITAPDGREVRYTYTANGLLATETAAVVAPTTNGYQTNGTTRYSYDLNNRLTRVSYPNGRYISYSYDAAGRLQSRSTADGSWSYLYDASGNVTQITDPQGRNIQYSYDGDNRPQLTTYPDGSRSLREYDTLTHLQQIAWQNSSGQLQNGSVYTFYPNDRIQTLTRYDSSSGLTVTTASQTNAATGTTNSVAHWALTNPATLASYTYDTTNQLTQETLIDYRHNTEYITTWTYDNVGNRLTQTKTTQGIDANGNPSGTASTRTTAYTYDTTDRLTQSTDTDSTGASVTTTYTWDLNGRLTQKATPSQITQYTWRSDDRLVQVQQGSTPATLQTLATYQYDSHGNRTQRTLYVTDPNNPTGPLIPQTTTYLVDEGFAHAQTLEEIQSTAAGQSSRTLYTWGVDENLIGSTQDNGSITGPQQHYYQADGLGSIITQSDSAGQITQSYSYSAFGDTDGSTPSDTNPYRYAGEYKDIAIGLQYNRARWYDPATGRFISFDGFSGAQADPLSLNHYIYTENDPIGTGDPSGNYSLLNLVVGMEVAAMATLLPIPLDPNSSQCSASNLFASAANGAIFAMGVFIATGPIGLAIMGVGFSVIAANDLLSNFSNLTNCQRAMDALAVLGGAAAAPEAAASVGGALSQVARIHGFEIDPILASDSLAVALTKLESVVGKLATYYKRVSGWAGGLTKEQTLYLRQVLRTGYTKYILPLTDPPYSVWHTTRDYRKRSTPPYCTH